MHIGIGLPGHIAHVPGPLTVQWARRAEHRGFAGLATIDRLVYESLDSIVALSVAAGATSEIGLTTNVLLAPLYPATLLAKQVATVAAVAGGRLTLGLGVGSRTDDYAAVGVDFGRRGRLLDASVGLMREAWRATPVTGDRALCPAPVQVPIVFGGKSEATLRRVATVGDGWSAGAVRDYHNQSLFADRIRDAWRGAGRAGRPQLHASVNFAFGDEETVRAGRLHLQSYYGFVPDYAALNVADMLTAPQDAAATVHAYRDLGFDGLVFHPCVAALDQVDRLADAVL
ncbi:LLM class flavin-dependent oxidoreductase [Mycobacterium paraseoulense]|uniref:Oxidoreductase n=1 Tax=Mycobacterium paraseoulense TaxID=590652 RepID=A0A1X0I2S9_9MYCO|nr:LLM class flavin-dependent oxidoreductase [Mycobacterium paraseoulense]MCV7393302.1 LLM class flavin-dependent oxidoreductase [Mycobacterium paraseoulense]ORB33322.1 oxidoreductase [Mycobacterium paraseoulense]BBZ69010.1 luciferase [Mycobacterium paraseoulense]